MIPTSYKLETDTDYRGLYRQIERGYCHRSYKVYGYCLKKYDNKSWKNRIDLLKIIYTASEYYCIRPISAHQF